MKLFGFLQLFCGSHFHLPHGIASFLSHGMSQFLLSPVTAGWAKGTAVLRLFPGVADAVWLSSRTQQSRGLMSSRCTFASGEALITASALFCCRPFCGLISHSATDFHQPFENLLMPLVFLKFDWNWPDLLG